MICLQRASDYISISITLWFHSFCYYNSYEIDSIHEWKESFGRSSIHPLNMSNETKASVDVATFQVAQTKKKLSTGHTSIKRNIQIVKAKARRAVAVTTEKRIFCCLCFDLIWLAVFFCCMRICTFLLLSSSERSHFEYTFVWGVYIKILSSYAKQQKNYILNEMKRKNEWMKNHLKLYKSQRT